MPTENHDFSCPHDHGSLSGAHHDHARRTWFVTILTAATMVVEIVSGLLFGSMALLADGWHMASHSSALGIAAMAYYFADKHKANPNFSFGTGKINDLAAYSSALLLAVIALIMAYESVLRLVEPRPILYTEAILVAGVGLVVNVISALILKEDPDHHHGRDHDHNLRAAYVHVLADALTSILAIVALLFGKTLGWAFMDPLMGIAGSLVISRWSYGLLKETGKVLLDHNTDAHLRGEIRGALRAAGAVSVDDLHLWRIGQGRYCAVIALTSPGDLTPSDFKATLCGFHQLCHVTVEVNWAQSDHNEDCELRTSNIEF